ncbi:MAG: pilus assembly protein MshP [Deltaproteobacteria bacterium]|jgi:MSHA biogenesis protein MshP|nr:pilus assembly protein MshP [Deltaproteobacteria bacterium]
MNLNNQNGFTIVQAIFILVVLALLGTFMVSLSTIQQATTTQAILQARVYQAARAGLEWEISQVVNAGSCTNATFDVDGYTVVATCVLSGNYTEAATTYGVYQLKAVAAYADISSPDYVSRTLKVTIHD